MRHKILRKLFPSYLLVTLVAIAGITAVFSIFIRKAFLAETYSHLEVYQQTVQNSFLQHPDQGLTKSPVRRLPSGNCLAAGSQPHQMKKNVEMKPQMVKMPAGDAERAQPTSDCNPTTGPA